MKNYKALIVFIVCGFIYMVILLFVLNNSNKQNDKIYLVLDNQINYSYKNGEYTEIDNEEIENIQEKFNVYIDNKNIGKYSLKAGNVWNLFDSENNYKYYKGYLFATNGKVKISDVNSRKLTESEKEMLEKKYNIKIKETINVEEVYDIYLNNNDISDKIICVSYSEVGENTSEFYNLILTNIDGEINTIIKEKGEEVNSLYYIKGIFKIDNEKNNSFIVQKIENYNGDIENYSINDYIYQYKKGIYKKMIGGN